MVSATIPNWNLKSLRKEEEMFDGLRRIQSSIGEPERAEEFPPPGYEVEVRIVEVPAAVAEISPKTGQIRRKQGESISTLGGFFSDEKHRSLLGTISIELQLASDVFSRVRGIFSSSEDGTRFFCKGFPLIRRHRRPNHYEIGSFPPGFFFPAATEIISYRFLTPAEDRELEKILRNLKERKKGE